MKVKVYVVPVWCGTVRFLCFDRTPIAWWKRRAKNRVGWVIRFLWFGLIVDREEV